VAQESTVHVLVAIGLGSRSRVPDLDSGIFGRNFWKGGRGPGNSY